MRRTLLVLALLAAPALADETADSLAKADGAFAAADYKTAVALYEKLDAKVSPDVKSAMDERLRFARRQLGSTPATAPAVDVAALLAPSPSPAGAPLVTSTAVAPTTRPARTPHQRPADGQTLEISLHDLGNFDYNEDDDKTIPDDVRKLDGCTVKVQGVMLPLDQAGRVTRFMLVNDMMSCCYGTAPKLQNVAMVELPKDKWIAATTDRICVEGKLKVSVKREDGFVLNIFQIEPSSIKMVAE